MIGKLQEGMYFFLFWFCCFHITYRLLTECWMFQVNISQIECICLNLIFYYHYRSNRTESFQSQIGNRLANKLLCNCIRIISIKIEHFRSSGRFWVEFSKLNHLHLWIFVWTDQSNINYKRNATAHIIYLFIIIEPFGSIQLHCGCNSSPLTEK